jgi:hypothetical protein
VVELPPCAPFAHPFGFGGGRGPTLLLLLLGFYGDPGVCFAIIAHIQPAVLANMLPPPVELPNVHEAQHANAAAVVGQKMFGPPHKLFCWCRCRCCCCCCTLLCGWWEKPQGLYGPPDHPSLHSLVQ